MGLEYVQMVQSEYRRKQNKIRRRNEIRKQWIYTTLFVLAIIIVAMFSNLDVIKESVATGQVVEFEVRNATTEDEGLTVMVAGGVADGHVWDVPLNKAKYFEDGSHVEVWFNTQGTEDVSDDTIIKVTRPAI